MHKDITRGFTKYHPSLNNVGSIDSPPVRSIWVTLTVIEQWLEQAGSDLSPAAFIKFAQGRKNYDVGIDPPIQSWDPNCKKGTDALAFGRWHWDASKQTAHQGPRAFAEKRQPNFRRR